MIILNMLYKVEKTYISRKLGLYISNLPNGCENNWQDGIKETLKTAYEVISNKMIILEGLYDKKEN